MRNTSPLAERNEHANIEPIQKSPKQATNIISDNLKFAEETNMGNELCLLHFDSALFFLLTAQSYESHQFTEENKNSSCVCVNASTVARIEWDFARNWSTESLYGSQLAASTDVAVVFYAVHSSCSKNIHANRAFKLKYELGFKWCPPFTRCTCASRQLKIVCYVCHMPSVMMSTRTR